MTESLDDVRIRTEKMRKINKILAEEGLSKITVEDYKKLKNLKKIEEKKKR